LEGGVDWRERYLEVCEHNMTLREKLEMLEAQLARYNVQACGSGHSEEEQQPSDSPGSKGGAAASAQEAAAGEEGAGEAQGALRP
jgi:hypothetical protein